MGVHLTGWITRASTTRPTVPTLPADRATVLAAVLHPDCMPTPPDVALRIVDVASKPDCSAGEFINLVNQDPVLCAKLLKSVNSSQYGLSRPIGSIDRAVMVIGINRLRSLALGLALPALRPQSGQDPGARKHSLSSVGGAIVARELALRLGYPSPEDDLAAGLLRDLGELLLQQTFPRAWAALALLPSDPLEEQRCERERQLFSVDHAEVAAELLKSWNFPPEVVEPIRHHHHPDRLAGTAYAARTELLWFAGQLTRLDALSEHPDALDRVITVARDSFGLRLTDLAAFLDGVVPKIDQFAALLNRDIGECPKFAALLRHVTADMWKPPGASDPTPTTFAGTRVVGRSWPG